MNNNSPVVSTIVITYNQESYIKHALQSIVSQKTNFQHEVIVADDCSQDHTQDIILEFAKKYPKVVKPVLRKKNIGAWENFTNAIQKAEGQYIALCEGDDYWTDNRKLQKQVNFLRKNSDYSICFHPVLVRYEKGELEDTIFPEKKNNFTVKSLLESNFIQTNSVMYKKRDYTSLAKDIMPGDWYLHLYHAQFGKIGFINKTMSVYRRHDQGIWWESKNNVGIIWRKHGIEHLKLYQEMLRMFGNDKSMKETVLKNINRMAENIFKLDNANELKNRLIEEFPDTTLDFIIHLQTSYAELEKQKEKLDTEIYNNKLEINNKNLEINQLRHESALIKESMTWRVRNKIARFIGKEKV